MEELLHLVLCVLSTLATALCLLLASAGALQAGSYARPTLPWSIANGNHPAAAESDTPVSTCSSHRL